MANRSKPRKKPSWLRWRNCRQSSRSTKRLRPIHFSAQPRKIERGDIASALAKTVYRIDGALEIGGQDHFYLESMACIAIPGEFRTMTINSSTQHPSEVQAMVAEVLGVPFNHVTVICKRMGGGFGGKETQAAQPAMMAALLAVRTGRSVRFLYTKDDDMRFTGKRHPFKYRLPRRVRFRGANPRAGCRAVFQRRLLDGPFDGGAGAGDAPRRQRVFHSEHPHRRPNLQNQFAQQHRLPRLRRAAGRAGTENLIEEIAAALHRDALEIRQINCYGIDDRNVTPYGQTVGNNTLPELFATLADECDYRRRRNEIARFNLESATHLRGMSLSAVKFGISFTRKSMNQANALVNIYMDGSVLLSSGATEMGQGVYARLRQIAAEELGIRYEQTRCAPTNTDKNNNTSPTAASAATDLNGGAVVDACVKLRDRLADIAGKMLKCPPANICFEMGFVFNSQSPAKRITFAEVVAQAYEERINLGERGFYVTPGVDFDRETGKGTPFLYYTNGVACSEVSIDRFTGQVTTLRTDLIMDAGKNINPGIDRGQVVGGFIQGMGWVTTEELVYGPGGQLLSYSPTTYKIPNISDVAGNLQCAIPGQSEQPGELVSLQSCGRTAAAFGNERLARGKKRSTASRRDRAVGPQSSGYRRARCFWLWKKSAAIQPIPRTNPASRFARLKSPRRLSFGEPALRSCRLQSNNSFHFSNSEAAIR